MTDTLPPPLKQLAAFIGDVARPFAIISTASAVSVATVVIAFRVTTFGEGAAFIVAAFAGVVGLYGAKAAEVAKASKHDAQVKIAEAAAGGGQGGPA